MSLGNAIKRIAGSMDGQQGVCRHAIVVGVNPANSTVTVQYDEQGTVSGWLPVAQMAAGPGWSVVTLPVPGTQVFVAPDMGDQSHGVVLGAVQSSAQPTAQILPYGSTTPQAITPGEAVLTHASGASIRLTAGAIEIVGTLKVTGDIIASGNIFDLNSIHESLELLRTFHNQHVHPVPDGTSGVPNLITP